MVKQKLIPSWIKLKFRSLYDIQIEPCKKEITESDLYSTMKSMVSNKSPGIDGLTKEFYEIPWDKVINLFYKSVNDAKKKN